MEKSKNTVGKNTNTTDKSSIKVWTAINKNGFLVLFKDKPIRDEESGKWLGSMYANSLVYKGIKEIMDKAQYTWNNEPEYFEFQYK